MPLEVQVWSHPDYEGLVAEVTCAEGVVAIVSEPSGAGGDYRVELFAPLVGQRAWRFEVGVLRAALDEAVTELRRLRRDGGAGEAGG
ncbi:MAG TPA: hypothetical protein VD997_07045 [Phycisphaerales bacterium]|nr:hypothetical protein [Phycisphaerales bacterium]